MSSWASEAALHLAIAVRSVGIGLATAMWLSVLTAHLDLPADARTNIGIGGSALATVVAQVLSRQPRQSSDELQVQKPRHAHR